MASRRDRLRQPARAGAHTACSQHGDAHKDARGAAARDGRGGPTGTPGSLHVQLATPSVLPAGELVPAGHITQELPAQ